MIELRDGIIFHNFMLDLQPESWFKKQSGETKTEWIKRVSYKTEKQSDRLWRKQNKHWLNTSKDFTLSLLAFKSFFELSLEQMEEDLGFELDLTGKHDWKMSEIEKIRQYTVKWTN